MHGYDHPWAGGAGKNGLNVTATTTTDGGVTFTVNSDGTVTANGTATETITFNLTNGFIPFPSGNYIINGGVDNNIRVYANPDRTQGYYSGGADSVAFNVSTELVARIQIESGTVCNNVLIKPMIRLSTVTDSAFAPYSNICPISGRTETTVNNAGKNVIPLTVTSAKSNNTGGTWSGNVYTINGGKIEVLSDDGTTVKGLKLNGTFSAMSAFAIYFNYTAKAAMTLNGCPSGGGVSSYQLDINGGQNPDTGSGSTIAANTAVTNVRLRIGSGFTASGQIIKPMLSYEGGDYEPYRETVSVTIQLGQTVYGGQVDFKTGVVTVTHGYIASYNGETLPGAWISDRDVYAAGTTPTTDAEVCYELATPTTLSLTPDILTMLKNNNSVSGDGVITITALTGDSWS